MTGAQHRFNVVTMPADASRLNNSSANHRVWILCRKSVHELQKTGEECPKSLSNPQKRIPHPQNRGGVPYTPTRPLLLPYTLVGTLPRICHIYIYIYPLIYTPLPYSMWLHSKVRAKGTTWCIHVAEGTKLDQNGLKTGSIHLFVHPQWSRVTFGKM